MTNKTHQRAKRRRKMRAHQAATLVTSRTLANLHTLLSLWADVPSRCRGFLIGLPNDAFSDLSNDDALRLLVILFNSVHIDTEEFLTQLNEPDPLEWLTDYVGWKDVERYAPTCSVCSGGATSQHYSWTNHPTCPSCTRRIQLALELFPLLFTRGLQIETDQQWPRCNPLVESTISWIMNNLDSVDPILIRRLYSPFLSLYTDCPDGYTFLMEIARNAADDPRKIRILDELLPVLTLQDFHEGNSYYFDCNMSASAVSMLFRPIEQFHSIWYYYPYDVTNPIFNPVEEQYDTTRLFGGSWTNPPHPIPVGKYFAPEYDHAFKLWKSIRWMLRDVTSAIVPPRRRMSTWAPAEDKQICLRRQCMLQLNTTVPTRVTVEHSVARRMCAIRRIHRFWRDVCYNPLYAFARKRLEHQLESV